MAKNRVYPKRNHPMDECEYCSHTRFEHKGRVLGMETGCLHMDCVCEMFV